MRIVGSTERTPAAQAARRVRRRSPAGRSTRIANSAVAPVQTVRNDCASSSSITSTSKPSTSLTGTSTTSPSGKRAIEQYCHDHPEALKSNADPVRLPRRGSRGGPAAAADGRVQGDSLQRDHAAPEASDEGFDVEKEREYSRGRASAQPHGVIGMGLRSSRRWPPSSRMQCKRIRWQADPTMERDAKATQMQPREARRFLSRAAGAWWQAGQGDARSRVDAAAAVARSLLNVSEKQFHPVHDPHRKGR